VREFVDRYFHQAFEAFVDSQRQFQHYMRDAMGLKDSSGAIWPMMFGPFSSARAAQQTGAQSPGDGNDTREAELREMVEKLRDQVSGLEDQLNRR
jgi:hypothetical protein